MTVTGYLYNYYFVCKRKIWFSAKRLNMESNSELVTIGKFIDENTYNREKHGINIEDIANIDYLKNNTVYEVKKSDKQINAAINQVKFYLYQLHIRGLKDIQGQINFPLLKKTQKVVLDDNDIKEIPKIINKIKLIITSEKAPEIILSKACKACAYYDLCMV